jgi:hypothetical protein
MAKNFIEIGASAPWPAPGSLVGFTGDSPGRKKKKRRLPAPEKLTSARKALD